MPRKPKVEKKEITVVLDGVPVEVILHPPAGARRSWYAYWSGLVASRSTGHADLGQAVSAAEHMVRAWKAGGDGNRPRPTDAVLTDEEFEAVQRAHYDRKKGEKTQRRAEKSLESCLEAWRAFRDIIRMEPISFALPAASASPDICAAFQRVALRLPRNWRSKHPRSKKDQRGLSPRTVVKWSVALAAAFERVNRNAGKKCVRGIVAEHKLLDGNPWRQFSWAVEGPKERPIRQFDAGELVGLLDYLAQEWPGVTVAAALARVFLWSACRKEEVVGLTWGQHREVHGEHHFDVEAKWGVRRWFRVPQSLYKELESLRVGDSPYVFAAYNAQLRRQHEGGKRPWLAKLVGAEFDPVCLGDWFYERIKGWAKTLPKGDAYVHVFRKTSLQFARAGEDVNRRVAEDARVGEAVLLGHYVTEQDEQLRAKSNRTFQRIAASLPAEVALRYGSARPRTDPLEERLKAAVAAADWATVAHVGAELERVRGGRAG